MEKHMSKRLRQFPTAPTINGAVKMPEGIALSDKAALFWERFAKHMDNAINAFNGHVVNARTTMAAIVIEMEGYSTDTHAFDIDRMRIIPRDELPKVSQ
jgi:hypothetical protein